MRDEVIGGCLSLLLVLAVYFSLIAAIVYVAVKAARFALS
jgi:hypothetical protein